MFDEVALIGLRSVSGIPQLSLRNDGAAVDRTHGARKNAALRSGVTHEKRDNAPLRGALSPEGLFLFVIPSKARDQRWSDSFSGLRFQANQFAVVPPCAPKKAALQLGWQIKQSRNG